MAQLLTRLRKLEELAGNANNPARQIVVERGDASDEEVKAFLASQGVTVGSADQAVYFRTLYERREGGFDSAPLQLLSVTHLAHRPRAARP